MDTLDDDKLGMTDAQWETFQRLTHGFGEQSEDGTDLSHLRYNLTLTPTERLEKHRRAYERAVEVQNAAFSAGLRRHPVIQENE